MQRSAGLPRATAQSVSRTELLQHRLRNYEEHESSGLGERNARNRLPVLQLFQSSQFRISRQLEFVADLRTYLLSGAAANHDLGQWARRRCIAKNDSVEGSVAVLAA